jgi:hypothetical protein
LPIQRAVLNGFADVIGCDGFHAGEVGDGAGDFQDAVVGARTEVYAGFSFFMGITPASASHRQTFAIHRKRTRRHYGRFCPMSAKQFQHYMSLQQQLAGFRRGTRPAAKARTPRVSAAVTEAKDWLAAAAKRR